MSIDNQIRIDHGNDFTLVDENEFYYNLDKLSQRAESTRLLLEGLSHGSVNSKYFKKMSDMDEIVSYKIKTLDEQKKLYYTYLLSEKKDEFFKIDYESMHGFDK